MKLTSILLDYSGKRAFSSAKMGHIMGFFVRNLARNFYRSNHENIIKIGHLSKWYIPMIFIIVEL